MAFHTTVPFAVKPCSTGTSRGSSKSSSSTPPVGLTAISRAWSTLVSLTHSALAPGSSSGRSVMPRSAHCPLAST